MGIAQKTGVETGGRGRDAGRYTSPMALGLLWRTLPKSPAIGVAVAVIRASRPNLQERGGPGLLTVRAGFAHA